MSNGGFSERRSTNSLGLGIIVAGHAVLLTAIALNPTKRGGLTKLDIGMSGYSA